MDAPFEDYTDVDLRNEITEIEADLTAGDAEYVDKVCDLIELVIEKRIRQGQLIRG